MPAARAKLHPHREHGPPAATLWRMPDPGHHQLSADYVRKVARLARLAPSDEQVEKYRGQLSAIITYMERLKTLDLAGVEPLANVGDFTNRMDEDGPGETLPNAVLMKMAPETMEPFIKVPKVLDEGGGA